jgi:8-oxo-dGTP pyrophosphatase MutT (NUDIX family)
VCGSSAARRRTGAAVALWCGHRVLLIQTSYRRRYSLPGGFVGRGERSRDAAARELLEEVRIAVDPDRLTLAYEGTIFVEYHDDRLDVWETTLADEAPAVRANARELVWAGWMTTEEAEAQPLLSHVRAYLAARKSRLT